MTPLEARRTIVLYSLMTTVVLTGFLIVSPLLIQIESQDTYRLVQIVFPVFAGYLGSAVLYLFQGARSEVTVADPTLLKYIVYGSFSIFWFLDVAVFGFFYLSNMPEIKIKGMQLGELANYLTLLIAFMNVTIGAMTAFLFNVNSSRVGFGANPSSNTQGAKQ